MFLFSKLVCACVPVFWSLNLCCFVSQFTVLAFGVLKQVMAVLIVERISLEDFCAGLFNPVLCLKRKFDQGWVLIVITFLMLYHLIQDDVYKCIPIVLFL